MPRRGQDGEAGAGSAEIIVIQRQLRAYRNPHRRRKLATEKAREIDGEYFRAHPGETSYVRPYLPGEGEGGSPLGVEPYLVVVVQAQPGTWVRGAIFDFSDPVEVRAEAEKMATALRQALSTGAKERYALRQALRMAQTQVGRA